MMKLNNDDLFSYQSPRGIMRRYVAAEKALKELCLGLRSAIITLTATMSSSKLLPFDQLHCSNTV